MRFALRFGAPLLIALVMLSAALTPIADNLVGQWFQRDLQLRSRLIFNAIEPSLRQFLDIGDTAQIYSLFNTIAEDERVLSIAWCGFDGSGRILSRAWPEGVACPVRGGAADSSTIKIGSGTILSATFNVGEETSPLGNLVILHDLSFVESRTATAQLYLMGFLALVSVVAAVITMATARLTLRGWLKSVRHLVSTGAEQESRHDPAIAPMVREIRQLVRELDSTAQTSTNIRVDWSPEALRRIIATELTGSQVIVVSNREPYIHNKGADGGVSLQRPASGMVTALEPIMRACGGTWIAHGSGTADRDVSDKHDHVAVPPHDPAYTLRRVWLTAHEQDGYYYGLANEGLWPLCHITFVRPIFRESDWEQYRAVNRRFADAVVSESTRPDPIILVQDYHFALLPRMIKERLPRATVIMFWHIPWPNSEVFGICPWREAIIDGLLGSSIIGFHTQLHCNNFIEAADRFIECHIDREEASVSVSGQPSHIRPYPISIAWPPESMEAQAPIPVCRARIIAEHALPARVQLMIGVERFDFTKGIPDRFRAVEILLEKHPELIGRFVLLQIAAPSRSKLPAYDDVQREANDVARAINERFGMETYRPIILVTEHYEPDRVFELYRAADACIVSSLHDGMNLVAKEFVAARDDNQGVLILSSFAGASRELMEALIVNPFDARASAEAIYRAMQMSAAEQAHRMELMRQMVSENNIYYWAGRMLLDAARIRKRSKLKSTIALATKGKRLSA